MVSASTNDSSSSTTRTVVAAPEPGSSPDLSDQCAGDPGQRVVLERDSLGPVELHQQTGLTVALGVDLGGEEGGRSLSRSAFCMLGASITIEKFTGVGTTAGNGGAEVRSASGSVSLIECSLPDGHRVSSHSTMGG